MGKPDLLVPLHSAGTSSEIDSTTYKPSFSLDNSNRNTLSLTGTTDPKPWWSVEFGGNQKYKVTKVQIKNRIHADPTIAGLLTGAQVKIRNE